MDVKDIEKVSYEELALTIISETNKIGNDLRQMQSSHEKLSELEKILLIKIEGDK